MSFDVSTTRATLRRHRLPRRSRVAMIAAFGAMGAAQVVGFAGPAGAAPCLSSGTDTTIQAALTGAGAAAVLCPGAVFNLSNTVRFTAPNQAIRTQGLPTDNTRAVLRIANAGLTGAINGGGQSGAVVENVEVDGNIGTYGRLGGEALLEMGNQGSDQTVQNSFIHDTRSWSMIHMMEGSVVNDVPQCQRARVVNNLILSSGTNVPSGSWADGVSLACGTSLVEGNTIIDATDGAIVIFGAPGSTVQNNTIIAQTRVMLGGINLVDFAPVHGNYTGTRVLNNVIDARGALIKVGVASGPGTWFCEPDTTRNHGASITNNTLQGAHMGYGFAVRGVTDWTISGNIDNSTHAGVAGSMCGGGTQNPQAPAGFQYYAPATQATLQSQFQAVTGDFWGLLNITENIGTAPRIYPARTALTFAPVPTGSASTAQSLTVTNVGPSPGTVSGVTVSGDYTQTNNCGSLPTGSSCVVYVTFRPSGTGTRTGTLTINGNAANSPATVSLSGTGGVGTASATLAASPSSLAFASTTVGSSSGAQSVTISNSGTAASTVSSVTVSGDFTQTNTCGTSIPAGGSCTATVTFGPSATGPRSGSLTVNSDATNPTLTVGLSGTGTTGSTNLAAGRPATAQTTNASYVPNNVTDGNVASYWESVNNVFPQWVQVDLGSTQQVNRVDLTLPSTWGARTQTIAVQGSTDGTTFTTLSAAAPRTFDPASGNLVSISFGTASVRYLRLVVSSNTGWPAAQISEIRVFGPGTGAATLSPSPTSVAFGNQNVNTTSAVRSVTITNTGGTTASVSTVTISGEFAQTNNCATLAAGASCAVNISFRPLTVGSKAGTLTVNSSASNPSLAVALSGTGVNPTTDLAAGRPTFESSHVQTYSSAAVTDSDPASYWESANNAFPQWVEIDLGSVQTISRVTLRLPPLASWATRTQTLSLLGSVDRVSYSTVLGSTPCTFNPSTGNTVTLSFAPVSVRYLRVQITGNTGWPAGQLSQVEVYNS